MSTVDLREVYKIHSGTLEFFSQQLHCKEWIQALLELHALSRFLDVKTKKDRVYSHPLWRPCVLLQVCEVCVHTCVRREAVLYCAQVMRGICVTWTHHEMRTAVRAQIVAARSHHKDGASGNMLWCASHATNSEKWLILKLIKGIFLKSSF